eukprot:11210639-Lingulodinium_polyedra.AAC.1
MRGLWALSCCRRKTAIHQLLRVSLSPNEQLVELAHMLDLWFARATLDRANEHHNVRTGVCKIGNCTGQRH